MVSAEIIIASYGLPIDFVASIQYGWKLGKKLCLATGFILTTTGNYIFILNNALIANLKRYYEIKNSLINSFFRYRINHNSGCAVIPTIPHYHQS